MDSLADTDVGAAAAEVIDIGVDVFIAGGGVALQKIHRCHDQPGLAVAALGNVFLKPGLLYRVQLQVSAGKTSMVVTDFPSRLDTEVIQARLALPSTCTVQEPHLPMPQPYLVPVS